MVVVVVLETAAKHAMCTLCTYAHANTKSKIVDLNIICFVLHLLVSFFGAVQPPPTNINVYVKPVAAFNASSVCYFMDYTVFVRPGAKKCLKKYFNQMRTQHVISTSKYFD